ncbi:MAG: methyltransferase domain-containing protein [Pyrinomonadaceae bacterium]
MLEARLSEPEVKEVYGKMARFYDFWAHLTEGKARTFGLEKSGIRNGMSILEVAVGTGLLFEQIVGKNPNGRNVGVDLTEEMLDRARRRLAGITSGCELKIGNALALEFEEESFDLVFNCYMLDLLPFEKIDAALTELRRVLKPDGKLVLVNMTEGKSPVSRIYQTLYRISPRLMGGCRALRMREKVLEKGFEIEHFEYFVQMFFPSEVIVAKKTNG